MKKEDALVRTTANGLIRLMIMWILNKRESLGYSIIKEIRRITGLKYHAGVIYPILYNLEDEGFIIGKWRKSGRRSIKDYSLTPEGISTLNGLKPFCLLP
ncbi:MAG: PadR family transcriptional regulator [Candidatus Methanomethylicaceae archaeon]